MTAKKGLAENFSATKEQNTIKIIALVILFLLPPGYLIFKTLLPADPAAGQPQPDIAAYEKAVNTNPTEDNLINLATAYINNKMPKKSIDLLKKAIETNPRNAVAYNNLGVAYTLLHQYQNGIDACTKALEIDGTFQLAKNNLAWAEAEKRKTIASAPK